MLDEKHSAFTEWQNDPTCTSKEDHFKHLQRKTQRELQRMQDSWWDNKAEEVQHNAEANNSKEFFSALKTVYGPSKPTNTPLLSFDGSTLLKDNGSILEYWKEHFSNLLNRSSTVDPTVPDSIPQKPTVQELDLPLP